MYWEQIKRSPSSNFCWIFSQSCEIKIALAQFHIDTGQTDKHKGHFSNFCKWVKFLAKGHKLLSKGRSCENESP